MSWFDLSKKKVLISEECIADNFTPSGWLAKCILTQKKKFGLISNSHQKKFRNVPEGTKLPCDYQQVQQKGQHAFELQVQPYSTQQVL